MSVAKVLEISASSTVSTDDAVKQGIAKAAETVHGITAAWVKDTQVVVENGKVTEWRVNLKITFVLE
ncbi:dodecin family protein [Rhodococcus sp. NPDC058514]|uniref:dodecin family protein n=1 Tax=unclassified Rhodococcus (in: high G+C Gram-positive bacteria) TaxID=192944 RepID=UPI00365ACE63